MEEVRKTVDHGNRSVTGHLLQGLLGRRSNNEEIHPPTQVACAVRRGLSHPQTNILGAKKYSLAPKLEHSGLKGNPCPQARLLKDQGKRFSVK